MHYLDTIKINSVAMHMIMMTKQPLLVTVKMAETNIQPIPSQKMITPLYSVKMNDLHRKIPQDMDAANATTDHRHLYRRGSW